MSQIKMEWRDEEEYSKLSIQRGDVVVFVGCFLLENGQWRPMLEYKFLEPTHNRASAKAAVVAELLWQNEVERIGLKSLK